MTTTTWIIIKDPQSVLPYTIRWASADGTNDGGATDTGWLQGDTIATSSWTITGQDALLIEDSDSNDTIDATIVVSAGTVEYDYLATNHITTALGYEDERSILIKVRQR